MQQGCFCVSTFMSNTITITPDLKHSKLKNARLSTALPFSSARKLPKKHQPENLKAGPPSAFGSKAKEPHDVVLFSFDVSCVSLFGGKPRTILSFFNSWCLQVLEVEKLGI